MKNTIAIVILMLVGSLASALPSGWIKPEGFAYTLSLYAQVQDENGEAVTVKGSTLAVFDSEGVCRGLKEVATNARGVTLYRISVASNEPAEAGLRLQIYNAANGEVAEIEEMLDFAANGVIGSDSQPQVYHVKPPVVLPSNWVKPEGYAYTLSLFAQVQKLDGSFVTTKGSKLAVFDADGVCRGLKAVSTNARGVTLYQLSVSSNDMSEKGLALKVADAETGEILDVAETLDFAANDIIGNGGKPQVFHVRPPYEIQGSLMVSWPGREDATLVLAADSDVEDAYSAGKDALAQSDDAYIVGQGAEGDVKLQRSVRKLQDETRWQVVVAIGPKATAAVSWNAFQADGRDCYLLQVDGCTAHSMAEAGSLLLENNGTAKKNVQLTVVCAKAGTLAVYELVPGWNLVSFPFVPSSSDATALLALKPLASSGNAYVRANAIEACKGYWLFAKWRTTLVLERKPVVSTPAFSKGGQLTGVSQRVATLPKGSSAFVWNEDAYSPVTTLEPMKGYWLFVP